MVDGTGVSRRSFVAGAAALVATVGTAAMGAAAVGEEAAAGEAAGPTTAVAVGGAAFEVPASWVPSPAEDIPAGTAAQFDVVDASTGETIGRARFTVGSPAEVAGSAWLEQTVFDGLARLETYEGDGWSAAVWGMERIDAGGVAMARALYGARVAGEDGTARPLLGRLYAALAPDWTLVYLQALAVPASFAVLEEQVAAVWAGASWPAAVESDGDGSRLAGFEEFALERAVLRNGTRPYLNPHWTVVGFSAMPPQAFDDATGFRPSSWSFEFATPDGTTAPDSDVVCYEVERGYDLPWVPVWAMRRTDSEGTGYLRSTAEVEGRGVVDVAHYDTEDPVVWYVAADGTPVLCPDPLVDARGADGTWTVYTGWNGEPWQHVVAG